MRALLFTACILWGAGAAAPVLRADNLTPPPMPPAQAEVYVKVTSRVLAPCCWSQPVRTHQSEAAEKVRAEVVNYVREGLGEQEIFSRLADEYGERILGEPRGARGTVAIVTPFAMLAAGLAILTQALFRLARRRPAALPYNGPLPEIPENEL